MADSKKYDGSQWEHSLRKMTTATEVVENPLYSDGTAITSYTIKGNTVQSGTPTPSNPITISGVGNKTANLLYANVSTTFNGNNCSVTTTANTSEVILNATSYNTDRICAITGLAINLKAGTYTACVDGLTKYSGVTYDRYYLRKSDTTVLVNNIMTDTPQTFTITEDTEIDRIVFVLKADTEYTNKKIKLWVMEGSTAKPYEPYGYKIPILTPQGSAVNYLGSVQSERQVYKMVLTGNEAWQLGSGATPYPYIAKADMPNVYLANSPLFCTHFVNGNDGMTIGNSYALLTNYTGIVTDIPSWKQWLADQLTAGTPVTVWYVLATATTGTVNEPLMKIGTYADTLSNATAIPTTEGANSITVDTTVQPSEFTATWTGWHDAYVKEKSENLLDMSQSVYGEGLTAGIGATTPTFAPSAATSHSGMIKVKSDTEYTIKLSEAPTTARSIYMYDSSQVFTRVYPTQQSTISLTITTGATEEYIIFGYNIDDTQAMLVEGSTAPSEFAPYWE